MKVSVIIPTYNRAKTICRCLDSVLNQTYRDIEVIVVDDCSQDETEVILTDIINKGISEVPLFYYRLSQNGGAPKARNYGLKKSKGDYVIFFDSDDEMHLDRIEKQVESLQNGSCNCSVCGYTILNDSGDRLDKIPIVNEKEHLLRQFWTGLYWSTQSWMYSRDLVLLVGGYDERLVAFQDMDLSFSIVCSGAIKLGVVKESLTIFNDCSDENRIMFKWKTEKGRESLKIVFDKVIKRTIELKLWSESSFFIKKELQMFFQILKPEDLRKEWNLVSFTILKNIMKAPSSLGFVYLVLYFCLQKLFLDVKFLCK